MTIEEIKAELAQRAGTDDVPEAYADEAAAWIKGMMRTVDEWVASTPDREGWFPTFGDKLQELTQYEQDLGMYTPEALAIPNPLVRAP